MVCQIIGQDLLGRDERGRLLTRIATVFPRANTIVTLPGIHATQRMAYVEALNQKRVADGSVPLTPEQQESEWFNAVDLVLEDDTILIRPDPADMGLAFEADELLQQIVSKKKIRFLHVLDPTVRDAIKRRGECWRISPLPRSADEMKRMIAASRIGIGGEEIYYYSPTGGTRILTCQQFAELSRLSEPDLRGHLAEIREYSAKGNRLGRPEVDFFAVEDSSLAADLAGYDFGAMDSPRLRAAYEALAARFRQSVRPEFREDDLESPQWRSRMYASLIGQTDKAVSEEALLGLSAEFFMQIEWLPGCRIEDGELILDPVFEEESAEPAGAQSPRICDEKAKRFIFNFIRDYGDLEYVNIGRVQGSLSQRPTAPGRRGVYLAEMQQKGEDRSILRILRMQKWGVAEHLDEGKDLLAAILESEQYTEYILNRRLGCRQLGMNLPLRVTARRIIERYAGSNRAYQGRTIRSPYFERAYVPDVATDKIPRGRFADEAFAVAFARLLGGAAAANLIVGRCGLQGHMVFDDGDELVIENEKGLPVDIVVADHTGAFGDYQRELREMVGEYAVPTRRRAAWAADPRAFCGAFLDAFVGRFGQIQQEYHRRQRAFDTLFRDEPRDEAGSFAYRWERVLTRLAGADLRELGELMRRGLGS